MKVGILTIIDNNNYGNRLQNYATNYVVKKLNNQINVETFINDADLNSKSTYIKGNLKCVKRKIKNIIKKTFFYKKYCIFFKRYNNFCEFNKNIKFSRKKINAFSKVKNYDYVIVGSDQVWNPTFGRLTSEVDLLGFVNSGRRIALAASFGVKKISDENKLRVGESLKTFKAISVREDAGKKIVEEISGRDDIEVLVDPTMLLTAEDWDKVSKKPVMLKCKKYILNYFLGKLSEKRADEIKKIAEENDCEIINILDKESPFYECGPSEFIYLEKNAFLICTDSFHSSVFAILYDVPFLVFEREDSMANMNSRLDTLLSKFELDDRRYTGKITENNLKCDYSKAYYILDQEKVKSMKFLEKALEVGENDGNDK